MKALVRFDLGNLGRLNGPRESPASLMRWALYAILLGNFLTPGTLYDSRGQRLGELRSDDRGNYEIIDKNGQRRAYGRESGPGSIEFYDAQTSQRKFEIRANPKERTFEIRR